MRVVIRPACLVNSTMKGNQHTPEQVIDKL